MSTPYITFPTKICGEFTATGHWVDSDGEQQAVQLFASTAIGVLTLVHNFMCEVGIEGTSEK